MSKISVIVPVHNEAKNLEANIRKLERALKMSLDDFEIIISEDGSTDRTAEIALSLKSDRVRIINSQKRLGKGAAINLASDRAAGEIIVFMDADLASKPSHVKKLVQYLDDGAAIVTGSRYMKESKAKRTPMRLIASKTYNWLVINIIGSNISDHQCGFKAFRKDLVMPIINEIDDEWWFWDTELLIRAQRKGLKVVEIPIEWKESGESKFRIIDDSLHMAYCLVCFKLKNG